MTETENIQTISIHDDAYPSLLREIPKPPVALFARGTLASLHHPIAIVGTRACTPYGKQVTQELVKELAAYGMTIISGLAFGIDGFAHEAALANGVRTIGVLGSGCDRAHVSPRSHTPLADRMIAAGGAVISEYPPGTESMPYMFPCRNRIVAGMSQATIVIEAPESSGALITAQCALEYNREVFAVPQNITSVTSVGTNNLIKMGAHPLTGIQDILEVLHIDAPRSSHTETPPPSSLSPLEAKIFSLLSREPIHIDLVAKQANIPSHEVSSALTMMEIGGTVRNLGGMMYVRNI